MKLLAALLTAVLLLAPVAISANEEHDAVVKRAHKYTHVITMETFLDNAKCSATAIGPHTLLTASHCELPTNEIAIDRKDANILAIARDGNDHSILFVTATFENWATFAKSAGEVGDDVFIFGNPSKYDDVFRRGYIVKIENPDCAICKGARSRVLYDLNNFHGDSGSAIFNTAGEIESVMSLMLTMSHDADPAASMKLSAGFLLAFTPEILQEALVFQPDKD